MNTETLTNTPAYLRLSDMRARYRVAGSTIWKWTKTNDLPAPVKLGANCTAWRLADLLAWEATRPQAK